MERNSEKIAWIRAILLTALMIGALTMRGAVGDGLRDGLTACGAQLIPSLFPMMALCGLFVRCGAAEAVGRALAGPMRRIGLPGAAGSVVLTAMIGGYPVGAQGIRTLRDRGALTDAQAAYMMRFCVCAGPGFGAMTGSLFGSPALGAMMYGAQVLAAVLLAILTRPRRAPAVPRDSAAPPPAPPFAQALTDAVSAAAQAMTALCAYVLLFAGICGALDHFCPRRPAILLIGALLEVTGGVRTARALGAPVLAAFLLGFGGLCVHAQLRAIYPGHVPGFWISRVAHGALTAAIFAGLRMIFPQKGILPAVAPAMSAGNGAFSAALLVLTAVFLLSIPENSSKRGATLSDLCYNGKNKKITLFARKIQ